MAAASTTALMSPRWKYDRDGFSVRSPICKTSPASWCSGRDCEVEFGLVRLQS